MLVSLGRYAYENGVNAGCGEQPSIVADRFCRYFHEELQVKKKASQGCNVILDFRKMPDGTVDTD
uniref:Uncharacterized protein n=1 Tax=Arion vulgaris TaxID=1028688 RepID=A0A0B6YBV2_9EUPU